MSISGFPEGGKAESREILPNRTWVYVPQASACSLKFQLPSRKEYSKMSVATLESFVMGNILICGFRPQCQKH